MEVDNKPNHTIYVNNLNEKIKKAGWYSYACELKYITNL